MATGIQLPDLDPAAGGEIVRDNLLAVQAIYYAWQLEEMRLFQVVERIVELFREGLLPLGRGRAGQALYDHPRVAANRLTERERRDLYERTFGVPNRDFDGLWLRFVAAVAAGTQTAAEPGAPLRSAALELGRNLSRHGYGVAYFAAVELQRSIVEFRNLLSDPDLRHAFGARDLWQVVDTVAANDLGGARNGLRQRTLARSGSAVIRWIADHAPQLAHPAGPWPAADPGLVTACEQWLAARALPDAGPQPAC